MLPTHKLIEIWRRISKKHNCKEMHLSLDTLGFLALADYRPLQYHLKSSRHR